MCMVGMYSTYSVHGNVRVPHSQTLGDKEKPELTSMLNEGHVLDFAELNNGT